MNCTPALLPPSCDRESTSSCCFEGFDRYPKLLLATFEPALKVELEPVTAGRSDAEEPPALLLLLLLLEPNELEPKLELPALDMMLAPALLLAPPRRPMLGILAEEAAVAAEDEDEDAAAEAAAEEEEDEPWLL